VAVFFFPHLNDGQASVFSGKRDPIVLRKEYRFYYFLSLLDGGRQQVFFSFGLFVLVSRFALDVPQVSLLLVAITFAGVLAGPWLGRMLDLHGERRMLGIVNVAYIVALSGYAFTDSLPVACACYIIYTFILPISGMGAATYLRKVATPDEVAPSLAMGVTMQHAAAIVVPVTAGVILNYVGYQIPFMIACAFSLVNVFVTRRLDPVAQRSPAKVAADNARLEAEADAAAAAAVNQTAEDQPGAAAPIELPRGRSAPVAGSGGND
jgi:MFS family permease